MIVIVREMKHVLVAKKQPAFVRRIVVLALNMIQKLALALVKNRRQFGIFIIKNV